MSIRARVLALRHRLAKVDPRALEHDEHDEHDERRAPLRERLPRL